MISSRFFSSGVYTAGSVLVPWVLFGTAGFLLGFGMSHLDVLFSHMFLDEILGDSIGVLNQLGQG
jgi:hypothetical protein